jgi:ribonuclease HI
MYHVIHFDGACQLNPTNNQINPGGIATYGWHISTIDGQILAYGYGEAGRGGNSTNNLAEYQALIKALEAFKALRLDNWDMLTIHGDSQLVIYQLSGLYSVKSQLLIPLYRQVKELLQDMRYKLEWVPREQNQDADDLSKRAYAEALHKPADTQPWEHRVKVVAKIPQLVN